MGSRGSPLAEVDDKLDRCLRVLDDSSLPLLGRVVAIASLPLSETEHAGPPMHHMRLVHPASSPMACSRVYWVFASFKHDIGHI